MKASEVITKMAELIKRHGDVEISLGIDKKQEIFPLNIERTSINTIEKNAVLYVTY